MLKAAGKVHSFTPTVECWPFGSDHACCNWTDMQTNPDFHWVIHTFRKLSNYALYRKGELGGAICMI